MTPIAGSEFTLEADAIVVPRSGRIRISRRSLQFARHRRRAPLDRRASATSADGVFAGGDVASTARFVTQAIGMGQRAAQEIDRGCTGRTDADAGRADRARRRARVDQHLLLPACGARDGAPARRPNSASRPMRKSSSASKLDEALAEAGALLFLRHLHFLRQLLHLLPGHGDQARWTGGYVVLTDYCKGCGLCVEECPTGSIACTRNAMKSGDARAKRACC